MRLDLRESRLAPWAGMFLGAAGWFLHHQAGSNANYWDCRLGGPLYTVILAVACSAIVAAGGWISWRIWRSPAGPDGMEPRSFAGLVAAGCAALFLFAIAMQTLGGLIVPKCMP
jgi:hypothetical protein